MSLCPHGYTAFWDCPHCPEPLGTAPDYLDKDVIPQPEALDAALAALQQRTTASCPLCHLEADRCVCGLWEALAGELPRAWPEDLP